MSILRDIFLTGGVSMGALLALAMAVRFVVWLDD